MRDALQILSSPENQQLSLLLPWLWMMLHSMALPVLTTLLLAVFVSALWYRRIFRRPAHALLALLLTPLATLAIFLILGLMIPTQIPPRTPETTLRVAHLNTLYYFNLSTADKHRFIQTSHADVVVLNEVNPQLQNELETQQPYPHQTASTEHVEGYHLPMMVLARWPITHLHAFNPRMHLYRIDRPQAPFHILHIHPQSPYLPLALTYRNDELKSLAETQLPTPLIIVGDVNTTPWDTALTPLKTQTTLQGPYLPTFPSFLPLTPIDLVLTSPNLPPTTLHRIKVNDTDHLGLIADWME